MTDHEREALLAKMRASVEQAKNLTKQQARQKLAQEGFCDAQGRLSPAYGGEQVAMEK